MAKDTATRQPQATESSPVTVPEFTIGLDVGDRYCWLCVLDREGMAIDDGRVTTSEIALRRRLGGYERARLVLETGAHSPWISRLGQELGHDVIVANARKLRMIYENESKSDQVDASMLARLGRFDPALLAPVQHQREEVQVDLAMVKARDALVRSRTDLINFVRGQLKPFGVRLPKCSAPAFHKRAAEHIPEELQASVGAVLETVATVTAKIKEYDRAIKKLCEEKYPETELLRQVKGVGPVVALAFVLVIGDPYRFRRSRSVGPYLGLVPRRDQSGSVDRKLGITKCGNPYLRRLLTNASQYILGPFGPDTDLRGWGTAKTSSSGKKCAVTAVARRLAVLLHRLWVTGEVYEPLRNGEAAKSIGELGVAS